MCLCVFVCPGVPNIKLVKYKNGICLHVHVHVYVSCVWYATYKLSIFAMFVNKPKSVKCGNLLKICNFKKNY